MGANACFLIEGYNGYSYDVSLDGSLKRILEEMDRMPQSMLEQMKNNSITLGQRITVETSAANFLSILWK